MSEASGDELVDDLRARWEKLFHDAGEVWEELWGAYTDPARHYHGIRHVHDSLRQMDLCLAELEDGRAVAAAIWFHDAVYDPTRSDNEAQSAELAVKRLTEMGEAETFAAKVRELIMDTRHVGTPASRDGQYLVDIDLSILGRGGSCLRRMTG